jgi:serine protease inhibitor ecotin
MHVKGIYPACDIKSMGSSSRQARSNRQLQVSCDLWQASREGNVCPDVKTYVRNLIVYLGQSDLTASHDRLRELVLRATNIDVLGQWSLIELIRT